MPGLESPWALAESLAWIWYVIRADADETEESGSLFTGSRPLSSCAHMPGGLSNGTKTSSFLIAHRAQMMKPETAIMMIDQTG